jgi:hypothetical protein
MSWEHSEDLIRRIDDDTAGSPAVADMVRPLLRDGLVPATVDDDLLILDADANQVVRIGCVGASIGDLTAVLGSHGLLAAPADRPLDSDIATKALSRRRMLQGAAAAGVVGVTVLTLPTAAMAASDGPAPNPSTTTPAPTTTEAPAAPASPTGIAAIPGDGVINVSWAAVTGATSYQVYYKLTSDDGTSWVPFGSPVAASPVGVTGLGTAASYDFYVVALNGATPSAPSDIASATLATGVGTTWTSQSTAGANLDWRSVTYGNGVFAAVAQSGTGSRAMTSTNGSTWVLRNTPADNDWLSVTHGMIDTSTTATPTGTLVPGFVAVSFDGDNIDGANRQVMTSPDGITWTGRAASQPAGWRAVTYGMIDSSTTATPNGTRIPGFVAVGQLGPVMTSPDGITWTNRVTGNQGTDLYGVAYGNGRFVAVSNSFKKLMTSTDGITWTFPFNAVADAGRWFSVAYGNGRFVAVGQGNVMTSTDGETWTAGSLPANAGQFWQEVTYGNGLFVAVSGDGTVQVITSTDGITWASQTKASANFWTSVTYGTGKFVAVSVTGSNNRVMTSP